MYNTYQEIVDGLRATPAILQNLLSDVDPHQGPEGGWSAVEIVCHLRDFEQRALERMRKMRDLDFPVIESYDQEVWAEERNYAGEDLPTALAAFNEYRETHAAELETLSLEGWRRTGNHTELGTIDIFSHSIHILSHDLNHAAQLARI